eukprot:4263649-Prymnesium_polylepis.1
MPPPPPLNAAAFSALQLLAAAAATAGGARASTHFRSTSVELSCRARRAVRCGAVRCARRAERRARRGAGRFPARPPSTHPATSPQLPTPLQAAGWHRVHVYSRAMHARAAFARACVHQCPCAYACGMRHVRARRSPRLAVRARGSEHPPPRQTPPCPQGRAAQTVRHPSAPPLASRAVPCQATCPAASRPPCPPAWGRLPAAWARGVCAREGGAE